MSEITEKIKQELLIKCKKSKEKDGYDFWNEHIKYVVENAIKLAKKYGADVEHHKTGLEEVCQVIYNTSRSNKCISRKTNIDRNNWL